MDADPTPGNPDEVRTLADDLGTFADDVGEALGRVRGMAEDRAVMDWAGLSAEAFRSEFDGVPGNLEKLQTSYDMAARALQSYWPQLETAQGMADRALDRAIAAQADLSSAQAALTDAQDWVSRAGEEADRLEREGVEPPSEAEVRAATRDASAANEAASSAQSRVDAAEEALSAARQLALAAREMREEAARVCADGIDAASDAGIQNRRWWEDAIHWVSENWDTIVEICKVVVAVLGIVVLIIGGPLAWVVLAAALVVLADTLYDYANGRASLWDVAFAALDCIPGMKGLTTLGGLAGGVAVLARGGLRGMAAGLRGLATRGRTMIADGMQSAYARARNMIPSGGTDPVDLATGHMFLPQIDVTLPGRLPFAFTRRVQSGYFAGRWFGPSWSSTIDQRLEVDEDGVVFLAEDGMILAYPHPKTPGAAVLPETGPRWPLTQQPDDDGGYTLTNPITGHTRHFRRPDEDGDCRLLGISDRHGNRVDIDYDPQGAPTAIRHSGGYHLTLTTEAGRVTTLALENAADDGSAVVVKRFGYTDGNLTEDINSSGLPLRFTYDERLRVTSWTDRNDRSYAYSYDDRDRCVAEGGEAGHVTVSLAYDGTHPDWPDARVTTLTTAQGATSRYVIDARHDVIAEIDPLGNTTRTEYDADHHVVAETDPLGHTTRFATGPSGLPAGITYADGTETRFDYDDMGRLSAVTLPDGSTTRRAYDERGNCVAVTEPTGATTSYAYDGAGRLTEVTDALGGRREVRCDAAGLPVTATDPLGAVSAWEHDAFGRIVAFTDPQGHTTRLTWTTEGQLLRRVTADGAVESWTYDGEGNCTSHTTPTGSVSRFEYTHFDLPAARIGPDGARYEFEHDASLRLTRVTNPQGLTWTYAYDAAGRLVAETDFDDRRVGYEHDAAGRLTARTNALGRTVRFAYDAMGRMTRKDSAGHVTTFGYDANGRLTEAKAPGSTLSLRRDANGLLLSETVNGRTLHYTHDELGRPVRRVTPGGVTTEWAYDAAGNRTRMDTAGRTVHFAHDWSGREVARRFGAGVTLTQDLDELGRLTAQSVTAGDGRRVQHRSYEYATDGSLVGIDDQRAGSRRYVLDQANRVTAVDGRNWTERYAYDAAGNQTDASWPAGHPGHAEATGTRDYTGTRVTRAGNTRYEHDQLGRITTRRQARPSHKPAAWHYTWDDEDRLTAVVTPDGSHWRYLYDPLGRRTTKQRLAPDGHTVVERVDFTWDGTALCEQTAWTPSHPHAVTLTWEHDGIRPIAQTERVIAPDAPQDEVDSRFFAIVTDLVGTPTELVDESGGIAWRTRTTLWGRVTWNADAVAYTPLRFPGQYFDPETGLHYNYFRHYDPETARYLSPDPLGLAPAPNPATYVHNPHTGMDPLGLSPYYSEIGPNGQRGAAYAEVTPQVLRDAAAGLIGSAAGRGRRFAPPGFGGDAAGHSRGHLIGRQFGGDGRDMRNLVTQGQAQNNGRISDVEDMIAAHVENTGNTVILSVTPEYASATADIPSHVLIEAVDDFGWSFRERIPNI
ncbi:hypothetical protein E1265_02370 [Streptomyces sp. 8K308]|uniref:DUF6531 domain-containing protein n=1 Tax=Streptomyces sp. 8K308 TaxID=2530388 RepID=UPI0010531115|nr:DUF6531 domain-containing protein [Streptomyces sp. 8K308]TDC27143.1 hypothetical protein E1265_02370 [Streptomyces sp. 8K308]